MMDPTDLHAFVDGELAVDQKAGIETSAIAMKEVEAIRSLKSMLREKSEAPEIGTSWKSCVKRLDEIDKSRKVERVVNRWAPALCGVLFVGIVGAGLFNHYTHWTAPPAQNLARFVGLPSNAPSDREHQERRLQESFSSTPNHLEIRRVSDGEIEGVQVRRFDMRDASGNLQILLVHEQMDFEGMRTLPDFPTVRVGMLGTTNCAARIDGNDTVVVIANRPYKDLAEVLNQVKAK